MEWELLIKILICKITIIHFTHPSSIHVFSYITFSVQEFGWQLLNGVLSMYRATFKVESG